MTNTDTLSTVIVLGHPDLNSSRVNAALIGSVEGIARVQVRDLAALYATGTLDVPAEQHALESAEEIILQYPTYWYSTPNLMKQWIDEVLTRGWAYGTGKPGALAGKRLRVVTTTGGTREEFATDGFHGWEFDNILIPLKAIARRLGMLWVEPFVIHGVRDLSETDLAHLGQRYRSLLQQELPAVAA